MNTYKRHRFPPDITSYAVWLYYRFNLSHRRCAGSLIEDLLAERGITISSETLLQKVIAISWRRTQESRDG
jgi:putative transposase